MNVSFPLLRLVTLTLTSRRRRRHFLYVRYWCNIYLFNLSERVFFRFIRQRKEEPRVIDLRFLIVLLHRLFIHLEIRLSSHMSMVNVLRRPLRLLMNSRLLLHRHQSQQMLDTLNEKKTLERESNDQLESVPLENTIDWNKKLKFHRMRGEEKIALKLFEIGVRKYQYQPDFITYVSMLEICKDIKDLDSGRYVHRLILKSSVRDNSRVHSLLMVGSSACSH